ncbi:helix-turn-helix domain-containing protein [Paenibacillus sp. N3.4]|uniref:helix-turn-helix domain-containing protein n=1 Tax=Paenibacillus sp. N3.4 TaxID=2603222 RepID=UPI0011C7889F|nr:helix-turn-helix domain-containing protein [Paenibacillus sp. N3.4]TXK84569.1 helix-turn-helix transcriptional regulator [Paenibacillus sp. N3.4]
MFNKRFFRKSLSMMLLAASIPGLIIGIGIYELAASKMESELQRLHQSQIQQRAENIVDQLAYLELTFSHWAFDTKFDDKLRDLNIAYDYEKVQELYRTLLVMEGTHPLLKRVDLFLDVPRPVLFNKDQFAYLSDSPELLPYESLFSEPKSLFWMHMMHSHQAKANGAETLKLVNKIPGGSSEPFGAIVATINEDKLINLLDTLTPYNEGTTLLMTKDGSWRLSGHDKGNPSGLVAALQQEYTRHSGTSESFLFDYDKTTYSVSYGEMSRLGNTWVYISAAPLTSITAPVLLLSKWIVIISFIGLLLALLMSWFLSKRIYSPVGRLVRLISGDRGEELKDEFDLLEQRWNHMAEESESLRVRLKEQQPLLRDSFFLELVQGYFYSLQENNLRERLRHYGWSTENRQYVVLMFQLSGFANLRGRFSVGDEELVTFAATNIIEELTGMHYEQAVTINFHNFSVGLLLSLPEDHPSHWLEEELDSFAQEAMQTIKRILNMQITIAVSKWTNQVKQISQLFEEARQALVYRDLLDEQQIIKTDRLFKANPQMDAGFPFTLEKEIVHAVRSGQEAEAMELIGQFMIALSGSSPTELTVQQGMLQLLGSIRYAVLQSGMNPVQLFGGVNLFEQLALIKEPEEMRAWLQQKVVDVFIRELTGRQDFHLKQLVEKSILYLREHYMDAISLDSCADKFEVSPFVLSRAFKSVAGINFIDYLTEIRIEHAKSMLRETELKINEVAERVGYQHTYFNRIFKKYEGSTPSQFREMHRS